MADNLGFDIKVNADRAKSELDVTESKIRSLRKEVKGLADDTAKDPIGLGKLIAANRELSKLTKTAEGMRKELGLVRAHAGHASNAILELSHGTRPINRLLNEFSTLSRGVKNFAGIAGIAFGGFKGGLAGLAAFKGFELIRGQLDETSKRLGVLRTQAGQLGVTPLVVQSVQEVARGAGQSADAAISIMQKMTDMIEKARNEAKQMPGDVGLKGPANVPQVFTGNEIQVGPTFTNEGKLVDVIQGDIKPVLDFANAWKILGIDIEQFPATAKGMLQTQLEIYRRFIMLSKVMDPQRMNVLAKQFGSTYPEMLKISQAEVTNLTAKIAELEKSNRGATDEAMADDERLRQSKEKLANQYDESMASIEKGLIGPKIALNDFTTELLKLPGNWDPIGDTAKQIGTEIGTGFNDAFKVLGTNLEEQRKKWADWWRSLGGIAEQGAADVSQTIQDIALSNPEAAIAPFARGGYVRGPGTSTSDSILARLSAGEFVLNAASVRRLGLGFLSGLNGFAAGGLVGVPRFADGGLVAAGGGTPVHLHLGSGSFALSGSSNVVEALVVEAHRQQMRSAGTKPSWFAGRPSGR